MNIDTTIPAGRDLLNHAIFDRKMASTDPRYNVKTCSLVYLDNKEAGVITLKPEDFIRKYWIGKELGNPSLPVQFIGNTFTITGTIKELVDWVERGMLPGVPS